MSTERRCALWLMLVLGLFIFSLTALLAVTNARERRIDFATGPALTELKNRLAAAPRDEALKARIRQEDVALRQDYFRNRRRFTLGATLLVLALAGWVASARWFVALAPVAPPQMPGPPPRPPRSAATHAVWAITAVAALPLFFLALAGLLTRHTLPSAEQIKRPQTQYVVPPSGGSSGAVPSLASVSRPQPALTPAATATLSPAVTIAAAQPSTPTTATSPTTTATTATTAPSANLGEPAVSQTFKQNWPCFRGPGNTGLAGEGAWPTAWNVAAKQNILWQTELPLAGKSSPIVWADRLFVTGGTDKEQRVACFDRQTGQLLWNQPVTGAPPAGEIKVFEDTGFAASTPVTDGRRVFAFFATGALVAFDFTGKQLWVRSFGPPESTYGLASSLLFYENTLILQLDQGAEPGKSQLLGLDPSTGQNRWATPRDVPNSWATPVLIKTGSRVELVASANPWVIAYDPAGGKELWRAKGMSGDVAPSPAFGAGLIFVTNANAKTMAIKPGGAGDVTATHVAWTCETGLPDIASPLCDGRRVLQADGSGHLACLEALTGRLLWETDLPSGVSSSPVLAGGKVYLSSQDGVTRVVQLGDAWAEGTQGEIGEPLNATPAFADGRIYIRGDKHLFCVEVAP